MSLMRIGYGGIAGYQLPLWVSKEADLSKKYGIELEPLLIGGGSLNMQALLGGSIQMSQNSAYSAIQAALRGAPLVLVATLDNKMPFQVVSRPEIKDPQQLKGKKIGILRFGGSNDTGMKLALKAWKIDPGQVTFLQTGGTSSRMSALVQGYIDATIFSQPDIYNARKLGMNVLGDVGDFSLFPNTSLMVTRSYLERQRRLVKNQLKAHVESLHYIRTNREGSQRVLKKYLKVNDPKAIETTYDFFARRFISLPRTDVEGITNFLKELGAPQRNPMEFIDMSLLDELEHEGFVQKLR